MSPALRAGAVYFALIFALGFVLGAARVLAVAPAIGELLATTIELPIMLAASWIVCGWCVRRFRVPRGAGARLVMGGLAFVLLMAAEASLSVLLAGRSFAEHLTRYAETGPALGLAAQLAFAAFPLLRR
ncbi:MAG: hypothetical protein NBV67_15930 [Tagaea sp.]|nr:hypothetical protein [Tagaea sp.]